MAVRTAPAKATAAEAESEVAPARVEVDLHHERLVTGPVGFVNALEGLVRERPVEEQLGLVELAVGLLHALSDAGYTRAERWTIDPVGWVALPEAPHRGSEEPLAHLVRAFVEGGWKRFDPSEGFHVTALAPDGRLASAALRRFHRERGHTVTIELPGRRATHQEGEELVKAVRSRLPVVRVRALGFAPAR